MAKVTITVDSRTGMTYIPKGIRSEGFIGKIEGLSHGFVICFIRPNTALLAIVKSLELVQKDINLRREQADSTPMGNDATKPAKLPPGPKATATHRRHPIFVRYSRQWLHEVTGFSLNYLCRIATGRAPLSRSFIRQACYALNQPESELFLPDAVRASPNPEGILTPEECDDPEK